MGFFSLLGEGGGGGGGGGGDMSYLVILLFNHPVLLSVCKHNYADIATRASLSYICRLQIYEAYKIVKIMHLRQNTDFNNLVLLHVVMRTYTNYTYQLTIDFYRNYCNF